MEQKKVRKTFRIEPDLWERFVRINDRLAVNGSEILRRMIEKYVEDKEKELGWGVEKMDKKDRVKKAFLEVQSSDTDWSLAADMFVAWCVEKNFECESFDDFVEWIREEQIENTWDFFYGYGSDFERFAADWVAEEEREEYLAFCRE